MRNLNVPMYDPEMVRPMREELTRLGFEELRTPEAVDAALASEQAPTLVVVYSVCGCAAPGFLTERAARFLALVAACSPAQGVILEIGSFNGKSTVGLASIARRYGLGRVIAVDPHTAPSVTDPDLGSQSSSWDDFLGTLRSAGLEGAVEPHRAFSRD